MRAAHTSAIDTTASERNRQARLSRVSLVAHLSGSIAHELTQPLTAILGNGQAALRLLDNGAASLEEVREILEDIVADGKRAGQVVHSLRALLAKGQPSRDAVDMNSVVEDVLRIMHSDLLAERVSASLRLAAGLPAVRGDRVQLQQVVLNLVVNACDAMAKLRPADRQLALATAIVDGDVRLRVDDSGPGIAPDLAEKIFEPFFTTKSHGLGMGLAICRNIATAHGGKLWAEPRGNGVFCLALPAAPQSP